MGTSVGYLSMACVYPRLEYKPPRLSTRAPSCTSGLFALSVPETDNRPGRVGCSLRD